MSRVLVLIGYLWRELFRSLTGLLVIVAAVVFYLVAIQSVIGAIDRDYYALIIGGFFGVFSLVMTIVLADRAFHAKSYLFIYRLPSRAIFLAALGLTAVLVSGVLELAVALVSLLKLETPPTAVMFLDIVPVWVAFLFLGAALGLHMSELVRRGWSRSGAYAVLAFILFSLNQQQSGVPVELSDRFSWVPHIMPDPAKWEWAVNVTNIIIWPVSAAVQVARSAPYSAVESLAPGILLLVSALLFWLAAVLFGRKDLFLPEA
jgi:hypothetical protein